MREVTSLIELKRDYYSRPRLYFSPLMVEAMIAEYGEKPATTGEALFVLHERSLDLLSCLPIIGKFIK